MIRQAAVVHRRPFFYVNQVGGNDEIVFDGHSIGIAADGRELVRAREFDEDFVVCDVAVGPSAPAAPGPRQARAGPSVEEAAYRALVLGLRRLHPQVRV